MTPARLQTRIVPASLLMEFALSTTLFVAPVLSAQEQNPQKSGDESWTATKQTSIPNTNPSRTTDSHSKSGNRTIDKQRVDVLGPNGQYQPSYETETETVDVDATTTRTVVRTYRWDGNGRRTLAQVTEEESRAAANGNAHVERKTSSADMNGNFQVIQREISDTKRISPDAEETKSTVYQRDSYGGLAQTRQTQEVKKHGAGDSVEVKTTKLKPDGNGSWKVSDVTEKTVKGDSKDRTTEERVLRSDLEGRLHEDSRTVSNESETAKGEKRKTVETYSIYAPEYTDGKVHFNQRVTTIQKKDSGGETTEQQVEQTNAGNPSDSPRVIEKAKYIVKYATPGTQQTKTVEKRDANGKFDPVSVEKQESNQARPAQDPAPPKDKP